MGDRAQHLDHWLCVNAGQFRVCAAFLDFECRDTEWSLLSTNVLGSGRVPVQVSVTLVVLPVASKALLETLFANVGCSLRC